MSKYALIENNEIIRLYNDLPRNWRNISNFYSLETELEYLDSLGWKLVQRAVTPEYDNTTHYLSQPTYNIVDNQVIETIEVLDITTPTTEQLELKRSSDHDVAMRALRDRRNALLAATDKTQLSDIVKKNGPELTIEYENYRQSLRDLANTYDADPNFVNVDTAIFPTEPSIQPTESPSDPEIPIADPPVTENLPEDTGGV